MALNIVHFSVAAGADNYHCDASGDLSGEYVSAAQAKQLEDALRKLIWNVHYALPFDASNAATDADILLSQLGAKPA